MPNGLMTLVSKPNQFANTNLQNVSESYKGFVNVLDFGAKGDGVSDDTIAIENATNYANGKLVWFPKGTYLITRKLNLTVFKYAWLGEKSEMGAIFRSASASAVGLSYQSVRINFVPSDATSYMVERYVLGGSSIIGPFSHENISFDFGAANGFKFGDEANHAGTESGQSYVFGVRFYDCDFRANYNDTQELDGRFIRTNRIMLHMTKCFEGVIDGLSLMGGDTQIRCYGCDRPKFSNVRSQHGALPFHFLSAGSFTVQHSIENLEVEGWIFSPIVSSGVRLSVSNCTYEGFDRAPGGKQDLTSLFGYTALLNAGSGNIVFSQDMTNILHPGLSIIKLEDAGNEFYTAIDSITGTTGTYLTGTNKLTWNSTGANITRFHGYGPFHRGNWSASYTNMGCGTDVDCPSFVYLVSRGSMLISNASAEAGTYGDIRSIVIGNVPESNQYLSQGMAFSNCTPLIYADPDHPIVRVNDITRLSASSENGNTSKRASFDDAFAGVTHIKRQWLFNPKRSASSSNNWHKTPTVKVAGEQNTNQMKWAWLLSTGVQFGLVDNSLPTVVDIEKYFSVSVLGKAKSGAASLNLVAAGNGTTLLNNLTFDSSNWKTEKFVTKLPNAWTGSRTDPGLRLTANNNEIYLDSILIEELSQDTHDESFGSAFTARRRAGSVTGLSSSYLPITSLPLSGLGDGQALFGRLWFASSTDNSSVKCYANCHGEFSFLVANPAGSTSNLTGSVREIYKNIDSINSSELNVDVYLSLTGNVNGDAEIRIMPIHSGTNAGANQANLIRWTLNLMDDAPNLNIYGN